MKLYSPPNNGFPQPLPDRWRFDNGQVVTNLASLTQHELELLDWQGPYEYPVAKQFDEEGNLLTEKWDYDPETHRFTWYKYFRKFVIIENDVNDIPYLDGQLVEPLIIPDWKKFQELAVSSTLLNQYVASIIPFAPLIAISIPTTIRDDVVKGSYSEFAALWNSMERIIVPPKELLEEIVKKAQECNLPQEFIDIFIVDHLLTNTEEVITEDSTVETTE